MGNILFLPNDYQAPKSSNFYMKFQEGENRFRILSKPILGWEDWQDKKPIRFRFNEKPAKPVDPKKPIKHFWSMIVWNYNEEEIQILHLTQTSIRKSLQALSTDKDWGAPYFYDLKVVKQGEGMETEYVLNPIPHKPLSEHIQHVFYDRRCNLEALFYGEDPFSKENTSFTEGIFSQEDVQNNSETSYKRISPQQAIDLDMILQECEPKYRIWALDYINRQYHIIKIEDLPEDVYERMKESATTNMNATYAKQREQFPEFLSAEA